MLIRARFAKTFSLAENQKTIPRQVQVVQQHQMNFMNLGPMEQMSQLRPPKTKKINNVTKLINLKSFLSVSRSYVFCMSLFIDFHIVSFAHSI